uniref:Uncharacterized protein n=1 Tax=Knipowitschia caucasica TaxID=637954 RepID=A0AAV2LCN9_KNICA
MNYQQHLATSAAIRGEIQRFESVHPNIYSIYELLERVEEPALQNQIREHVIAIEVSGRVLACLRLLLASCCHYPENGVAAVPCVSSRGRAEPRCECGSEPQTRSAFRPDSAEIVSEILLKWE